MNHNSININNSVLIWARETIALSINKVCEGTGISYTRLQQLESGNTFPTLEELKLLSKIYKRTIATLLLDNPPKEKPLPIDRRSLDSIQIGTFHEKTIIAIRKARALAMSFVELKEEFGDKFPIFNVSASLTDSPSIVVNHIHQRLQLNEIRQIKDINLAFDTYIEKIESLGIAVFQLSLTQDNLRGFSIVDDIIPIIGIKRGGESTHAKIFTLFHELGHIILNEGGICDLQEKTHIEIEKWCNGFAAEILMPVKELIKIDIVKEHQQKGEKIWAKKDLINLGNCFHVGPLAILRRLLEMGLTTQNFYNEKHKAWNKPTFGKSKNPEGRNIPKEAVKEKGKTYVGLAFKAFDQNKIDIKDLSDYLGIKISYITKTRNLLYM